MVMSLNKDITKRLNFDAVKTGVALDKNRMSRIESNHQALHRHIFNEIKTCTRIYFSLFSYITNYD